MCGICKKYCTNSIEFKRTNVAKGHICAFFGDIGGCVNGSCVKNVHSQTSRPQMVRPVPKVSCTMKSIVNMPKMSKIYCNNRKDMLY